MKISKPFSTGPYIEEVLQGVPIFRQPKVEVKGLQEGPVRPADKVDDEGPQGLLMMTGEAAMDEVSLFSPYGLFYLTAQYNVAARSLIPLEYTLFTTVKVVLSYLERRIPLAT